MALLVPLQAVPSQIVNINLDQQSTTLRVYQKRTGVYTDVLLNNVLLIGGVLSTNFNRIIRDLYFGYEGDFVYLDLQGSSPPYYTGLGSRWQLIWLSPDDLPAGVG